MLPATSTTLETNTKQNMKERMDGHFSQAARLSNNKEASDTFAKHFAQEGV
jgi:hypothetical protein